MHDNTQKKRFTKSQFKNLLDIILKYTYVQVHLII